RMLKNQACRRRIVYHDRAGTLGNPTQHGVLEVAMIRARACALPPKLACEIAMPFAVVVNEFLNVCGFVERTEKQVLEYRVVQYRHTRLGDGVPIDIPMKLIIAEMIQTDVRAPGRHFDRAALPESTKQRRRIIRHASARRWQGRFEPDGHVFLRLPNSAVPTRMCVAPSSMATPKSCDMPMERLGSASFSASSRSRRK